MKAERVLDYTFGLCERLAVASILTKRLQAEMKARDWSYSDLAEFLGTTKSQAHDWANGTHEPNLSSLRHIAKKFGCDLVELIEAA